jgi:hypothetical protein
MLRAAFGGQVTFVIEIFSCQKGKKTKGINAKCINAKSINVPI